MVAGCRTSKAAARSAAACLRLPVDLQQERDWLATELDDAPDFAVLAGATLPSVAKQLPIPAAIEGVQDLAATSADEHHLAAATADAAPRYTRLMLGIHRWLQAMHAIRAGD